MAALDPAVVGLWRSGALSTPVALTRLAWSGTPPAAIAAAARADPALAPLADAARSHAAGLALIERLRAAGRANDAVVDLAARAGAAAVAAPPDPAAQTRALFARAAAVSPDLASASYALGDPALLAAATAELLRVVEAWTGAVAGRRVLDLGCGSGRLTAALARAGARVVGIDLSAPMLAAARARIGDRAALAQVAGGDLAALRGGWADLVVATDMFPYLTPGGPAPAAAMLAECARVAAPGGSIALFHWSYRGDLAADCADAAAAARAAGLEMIRDGERPFSLWDAPGWLFRRPHRAGAPGG